MSINLKVFLLILLTAIIATSAFLTAKAVEIHSTTVRAAVFNPQVLDMTLYNNTRFASTLLNISFTHPISDLTLSLNGSTTGFNDIVNMNNGDSNTIKKPRVERGERYSINITSDLRHAINFPNGTYHGNITAVYINSDSNQPESFFVPVNLNLSAAPSSTEPHDVIEPCSTRSNYVCVPYNITLGYENGTNSSIGNVTYKVRFDAPAGKIVSGEVLNNTFDNNNTRLDNNNTVVFNATEIMENQSKIADVRLNLANFSIEKDPLPVAHVYVTINGTTQSSTIQLPRLDGLISEGIASSIPLTTTIIDKAEKVVDVAGKIVDVGKKGFDLANEIYKKTASCLKVQVDNSSANNNPLNPTWYIEMKNCSEHPEIIHSTITNLTRGVNVTYSTCEKEFEVGAKDNSQCKLTLELPPSIMDVKFIVRGDILIKQINSKDSRIQEISYRPLSPGNTTTLPPPTVTSTGLAANAGPDQIVSEGTKNVTLYGINSLDSNDNNTITEYRWEYMGSSNHSVEWSGINNTNTNTDNLKFDAPNVTSDTLWTFELTVTNDNKNSSSDIVNVLIRDINHPPVADNQTNVTTDEDAPKLITLTASDIEGDTLDYSIVSNPTHGNLSRVNSTTNNVIYTPTADYTGSDEFTFIASDGEYDSELATVSITVNSVNDPPEAHNSSVITDEDTPVTITLSGSDDMHDNSSLSFSIVSQPILGDLNATFTRINNTAVNTTYAPDLHSFGNDNFTFKVNDGILDSTTVGRVSITVNPVNHPPMANAGMDLVVNKNASRVTLNGSNSNDPDNGDSISSYRWIQTEGPQVNLTNDSTALPTFAVRPLPIKTDTILKFNLTVTDNHGANSTKPDTVVVTVRNVNTPPLANAGPDQTVNEGTKNVTLYGINSLDFDGNINGYRWKQIGSHSTSNSSVINNTNTNTPNLKFDAPNVTSDTLLTFELTVTDNKNSSDSDVVNVLIKHNQSQAGDINTPPETNGSGNNTTDITSNTDDGTLDNVNQPPVKENLSSIHMVFAIDSSGSMDDNDPEKLRLSLTTPFIDRLNRSRDNTAALISWDTNVDSFFGLTSNFTALENKINEVDSEGGTNLDVGLEAAINVLDVISNDNNSYKTIILISDGHGEYTPTDDQNSPVNDARNKGYTIFTIGLNVESQSDDENTLKNIANTTGGQYFLLSSEEDFDNIVSFISQQIAESFPGP